MTTPDQRYLYRATLTKDEPLRYLSHLDYAELVRRALRRAKLPLAYSLGYHPHPRLAFASALPVGTTTEAEFADLELTDPLPPARLRDRLSPMLPDGLRLLDVKLLAGRRRPLMATVAAAVYAVAVPKADAHALREAVAAFNARETAVITRANPKGTRTLDLKPLLLAPPLVADDGTLRLEIRVTPTGSAKPIELLRAMGVPTLPLRVHRLALLFDA